MGAPVSVTSLASRPELVGLELPSDFAEKLGQAVWGGRIVAWSPEAKSRVWTPEARHKMSVAMKAYRASHPLTEEVRRSFDRRGVSHSEETKKNLSLKLKRFWQDPEKGTPQREKMRQVGIRRFANPAARVRRAEINKELWRDPEYRAKQIAARTGKALSEEHRCRISAGLIGKSFSKPNIGLALKGRTDSENTKKKKSLAHIRRFADPVIRAERRENNKRLWQDPKYRQNTVAAIMKSMAIRPNKPETLLGQFLDELFPCQYCYVGDGQLILGGCCPDFANADGQKKLIELYGDYWHRGENPQDRIDFFASFGFQTLVIWERELDDLEVLSQKLTKFHNEEPL
jgi:hypothetical protein